MENIETANDINLDAIDTYETNTNQESSVDFTLKIQLNDGFDEKIKEYLDKSGITDNVLTGEKAIFALQTLHEADELILKKSVSKNEMPKSSIRLEMLTSNGEKIELPKVEMGRYLFKNADLNKIINVSSSNVVENQISQETQEAFANIVKKDKNGKFKTKINLDNILENGVKGLESIADSIGDEHLSSFVKNFTTAYNILGYKQEKEKPLTKDDLDKSINEALSNKDKPQTKIPDDAIKAIKSEASREISKIKKTEPKEKTISKPTDIARGI